MPRSPFTIRAARIAASSTPSKPSSPRGVPARTRAGAPTTPGVAFANLRDVSAPRSLVARGSEVFLPTPRVSLWSHWLHTVQTDQSVGEATLLMMASGLIALGIGAVAGNFALLIFGAVLIVSPNLSTLASYASLDRDFHQRALEGINRVWNEALAEAFENPGAEDHALYFCVREGMPMVPKLMGNYFEDYERRLASRTSRDPYFILALRHLAFSAHQIRQDPQAQRAWTAFLNIAKGMDYTPTLAAAVEWTIKTHVFLEAHRRLNEQVLDGFPHAELIREIRAKIA